MKRSHKRRRYLAWAALSGLFIEAAWWYLNRPRTLYTLADVTRWDSTYSGYRP